MAESEATKLRRRKYYRKNRRKILAYHKKIYRRKKELRKEQIKRWMHSAAGRKSKAKSERKYQLWVKYNITPEEFDQMLKNQNGMCAICSTTKNSERFQHLVVDHDHKTGQVRGLLCTPCNSGLGMFKDNLELVNRAAAYLANFNG